MITQPTDLEQFEAWETTRRQRRPRGDEGWDSMSTKPQCTCVICTTCKGRGSYYVDIGGKYLGPSRCDDLSYSEHCEECGGSGIDEECAECERARWDSQEDS